MIHEMSYAVQGAIRQEKRLEILANHMANSATTGFKSQVLSFDDMLQAQMTLDTRQGDLIATENPLDLAISGDGFFQDPDRPGSPLHPERQFRPERPGTPRQRRGSPGSWDRRPHHH